MHTYDLLRPFPSSPVLRGFRHRPAFSDAQKIFICDCSSVAACLRWWLALFSLWGLYTAFAISQQCEDYK